MLQHEDDARTGFGLHQHIYREHREEVTGCLQHIFGSWRRLVECLEWLYQIGGGNSTMTWVNGRIRSTCWLYSLGSIIIMLDKGGSSFTDTHIICDRCLQPFVDIDKSFYQRGMFIPINMMNKSYHTHILFRRSNCPVDRASTICGSIVCNVNPQIVMVQSAERCWPSKWNVSVILMMVNICLQIVLVWSMD